MGGSFSACDECGFAVEDGSAWCPNCGLYVQADEPSFFDRMFKGAKPGRRRHPENLIALEESLHAETARLRENLEQLARARSPLGQRIGRARAEGRDPGALQDALDELDRAETQARLLLSRHEGLLEGIKLERDHTALRAKMAGSEPHSPDQGMPEPTERAALSGPVHELRPWGEVLVGLSDQGRRLLLWSGAFQKKETLPLGQATALALLEDGIVVAGPAGVQTYRGGQWSPVLALSRATPTGLDAMGDRVILGTKQGDLFLIRVPPDPASPPRVEERIRHAHPFGVSGVCLLAQGNRALSSGSNHLKSWWVTSRGITPFSTSAMEGCERLHLHPAEDRLVVERGDRVALWDTGLTALQGEIPLRAGGLRWGPDGERLLTWHRGDVLLTSPRTRATVPLLELAGTITSACWLEDRLAVVRGDPVRGEWHLELHGTDQMGLTGWTLSALLAFQTVMQRCRPYVPADLKKRVMLDQALVKQGQDFVADAGRMAVLAIMRRAAAIEALDERLRIPALERLFEELPDLVEALRQGRSFTFALDNAVDRLHRLPTAVLLGQVDAILDAVQALFQDTAQAGEDELGRRVDRLEGISRWLDEVIRLSNGLKGEFWGTPDRRKLVDALLHLKGELPGLLDTLHASMAAAVLGRVDPLAEAHALDKLKAQRERVQGIGGVGAHAAEVALDEVVDGGAEGQERKAAERGQSLEALERAKRELGAETAAWLELRDDP